MNRSFTEIVASIAAEIASAHRRFPTSETEPEMFPGFKLSDRFKAEFNAALATFEAKGNDQALVSELQRLERGIRNMQNGFLRGAPKFFSGQFDRRLREFEMRLDADLEKRFTKAVEALADHVKPQVGFDLDIAGELYQKVQQLAIDLPVEQDRLDQVREAKEKKRLADKARRDKKKADLKAEQIRLAEEARRADQRMKEYARRKEITASIREQVGIKDETLDAETIAAIDKVQRGQDPELDRIIRDALDKTHEEEEAQRQLLAEVHGDQGVDFVGSETVQ